MIAFARPNCLPSSTTAAMTAATRDKPCAEPVAWQAGFLQLLPDILRQLRGAFRCFSAERREEAVQEAVANALVAYRRLAELGKTELAFATPLAKYAMRQVCGGRQVANSLNAREVLSRYAQRKGGFTVARLHQPDRTAGTWKELLVEDRRSTPAELAASRIDFAAWWGRLPARKRRIAAVLAAGATTSETARSFKLTAGRISQLRRELEASWRNFHGEPDVRAAEA